MSKPTDADGVVCPDSSNKTKIHTPERVYETLEHGKRVRRGILGKHQHRYQYKDCDWEGLPVVITPKPSVKGNEGNSERTNSRLFDGKSGMDLYTV